MVATYITKIERSVLCVTGVYVRSISNTIFPVLHLNVSHLNECLLFLFDNLLAFALFTGKVY